MRDIILMAMSTLSRIESYDYSYPTGDKKIFDCQSQLEPVTRYYLTKCRGNTVTFIILATEDTTKLNKQYNISALEFFWERIKKCSEFKGITGYDHKEIPLLETNPEKAINEAAEKIREIKSVKKKEKGEEGGNLYIVTNGGFRDISSIMNAIASLLKRENIEVAEICGTNVQEKKIVNQKKAFEVFEFVSGMNNFLEFGNTDILQKYYEGKEPQKSVEKMISAMNEISLGSQLCDPDTYIRGLDKLGDAIEKLKADEKAENDLISIFVNNIEEDYGPLLNRDKRSIVDVIKRCLEKKLYQQALTFLETYMPAYCFEHKILYFSDDSTDTIREAKRIKHLDFKSDINFVFDGYLNKCRYLFKYASNGRKRYKNDLTTKDVIDYFCGETSFEGWKKDKSFIDPGFKLKQNETLEIPLLTDYQSEEERKYAGEFIRLHKALKDCRNKINHGDSTDRPTIENIKIVLEKYIATAKKLEDFKK